MKKKLITLLTAIALVVAFGSGSLSKVMAADEDLGKIIDGSVLTEDEESEGVIDTDTIIYVGEEEDGDAGIMPYGTYLLDGTASIKNAGNGKVTASGVTSARSSCSLKLTVILQRYSSSTGTWGNVTSWSVSKSSGTYLSSTKTISVTKGYYYRVKCSHSAGGEAGYSYTNGIKIS